MSKVVSLRSVVQIAAIALVGFLGAVQIGSAISTTTATYYFTGTCSDCTGTGQGTLVLQNYTLGSSLTNANFVSWSYTSNLLTYSVTPASNPSFSIYGTMPATLPGASPNAVVIANQPNAGPTFMDFVAESNGSWCAGHTCADDNGTNGTWSAATPAPTTSVPALGMPALASLGLLLLFAAWILFKRFPGKHEA